MIDFSHTGETRSLFFFFYSYFFNTLQRVFAVRLAGFTPDWFSITAEIGEEYD